MENISRRKSKTQIAIFFAGVAIAAGVPAGVAAQDGRIPTSGQAQTRATDVPQAVTTTDQIIVVAGENLDAFRKSVPASFVDALKSAGLGDTYTVVGQRYDNAVILKLGSRIEVSDLETKLVSAAKSGKLNAQIEIDHPVYAFSPTPTDPQFGQSWGLQHPSTGIAAPTGWDSTYGGGSVIAVVDTGYLKHPDLYGTVSPFAMKVASPSLGTAQPIGPMLASSFLLESSGEPYGHDFWSNDTNPSDTGDWTTTPGQCGPGWVPANSSWHGTHVSGIATALTNSQGSLGATPNAKVLSVRVLGTCGGTLSQIENGITWASGGNVTGAPVNKFPADIINLSLGGKLSAPPYCPTSLQNAINAAVQRGSTVVVSAGNRMQDAGQFLPASCQNVITVAAHDQAGNRSVWNATFSQGSNYGAVVDVAAPGTQIFSTWNTGTTVPATHGYANYNGTSMAAPFVSSIAAAISSARPDLSPATIESIIKAQARPFTGACGQCGTGYADFKKSITAALAMPLPGNQNELYPFVNETVAQAQAIGTLPVGGATLLKGSLGPVGGPNTDLRDIYSIQLPPGRRIHVVPAHINIATKPQVQILNSTGTVLASTYFQGTFASPKATYFNSTTTPMTIYIRVNATGTAAFGYGVIVRM